MITASSRLVTRSAMFEGRDAELTAGLAMQLDVGAKM